MKETNPRRSHGLSLLINGMYPTDKSIETGSRGAIARAEVAEAVGVNTMTVYENGCMWR